MSLLDAPPQDRLPEPPAAPSAPTSEPQSSPVLLLALIASLLVAGALVSWWIPGLVAGLMFMLFMHELGHYLAARLSGMDVTAFFLGFGPRIWSFRTGGTEYGLKAIPAGAYVKILGMTWLEDVDPSKLDRTYRAQPWWQRMITICAGSAMHFLMALVALTALFAAYEYQGFQGPPWEVALVQPGSTADNVGVEVGDRIVTVNGDGIETWDDFRDVIADLRLAPISVEVERDGDLVPLSGITGARSEDVVGLGFGLVLDGPTANEGWRVTHVGVDTAADDFGFEVGDRITEFGSESRPSQSDLSVALLERDGQRVDFRVDRDGRDLSLAGDLELDRSIEFRGFFGVGADFVPVETGSFADSVSRAVDDFATIAASNVTSIFDMLSPSNLVSFFTGTGEPDRGSGPADSVPIPTPDEDAGRPVSIIGVGRLFAASDGPAEVLFLFAIVNVFIGVFNLLPLLPLDGGHAVVATWERAWQVIRRDRSYKFNIERLVPLTWAVIIVLVLVGVWAAALDIFFWTDG